MSQPVAPARDASTLRPRGLQLALALWVAFVLACVVIIARTEFRADFSAFLPSHPTAAQQVLVEQLTSGAGGSLLLVGIEAAADGPPAAAEVARLARLSGQLAARLRQGDAFRSVLNGETAATEDTGADQLLFKYRYLLSPAVDEAHFSVAGLRAAVQGSIDAIASGSGLLVKQLLARDPTGEMLRLIDRLLPAGGGPAMRDGHWFDREGRIALLLVQTRMGGSDIDAQQRALDQLRGSFAAALADDDRTGSAGPPATPATQVAQAAPQLLISGPGTFAVASREAIKRAVERLSLVGSLLILSLLYTIYRSVAALLLGVLPVVTAVLAGIAAVSLGFGTVHGITLGFGATLVGEAVDYAIYLFVQRGGMPQGARAALAADGYARNFWPTIRLGVLTSVCGFAALLLSGFQGLSQLGLFSIAGIVSAAIVTRWLLPGLLPANFQVRNTAALGHRLARIIDWSRCLRVPALALTAAAVAVLLLRGPQLFNAELLSLSPVPLAAQRLDSRLRADMGAPDVRFLLVLRGSDAQDALQRCEWLAGALDRAVDEGVLGGWQAPCTYLPSVAAQLARRAALPLDAELHARMTAALAGLPLKPATIEPFFADVAAARQSAPLRLADVQGAPFAGALDAMLSQVPADRAGRPAHWNALVQLQPPRPGAAGGQADPGGIDAAALRARIAPLLDADTVLLDLKTASNDLYRDYLQQALRLSALGLLAIAAVLSFSLRSARRVLAVGLPLLAAVALVAAGLHLLGVQLSLLHLVGLLLTVAVGSNYALFFDGQSQPGPRDPRIHASLLFAVLTTVAGFGVLAFASVPVLAAIGMTVGPGAVCAWLLSAILSQRPDAPPVVRVQPR